MDAAHGVYYVVETNNAINVNNGVEQAIYVGAITGTLADGHVRDKIFSTPAADFDFIYGMALDNTTGTLYFTQSALNQYNPANPGAVPLDQVSGVFSFDVSNINTTSTAGLTLRPESAMKLVAYLPRIVNGPNHGGLGVLYGVAVDPIHHKVYFIDDSMGSSKAEFSGNPWDTPTNNIYVADIAGTPSVATSILQLATGPKNGQVITARLHPGLPQRHHHRSEQPDALFHHLG